MKNEVLYIMLNGCAELEASFLSSAIACTEQGINPTPKYINKIVAPSMAAIRSCSGFHILPNYSFETMPQDYAALILIGGYGWTNEKETDKAAEIVHKAIAREKIVGAICNAVSFMAKYGFLNHVHHTGNGLEALQKWGGSYYTNQAGYINQQAVTDKNIVTANGTASLEFAKEILLLLENDTPKNINMFYRFHKLGLTETMRRMNLK